jgi:hypothetical protein
LFVHGATHSLGTLGAWRIGELVPSVTARPPIDRSEFLELLAEISPHAVRVTGMGAVAGTVHPQ